MERSNHKNYTELYWRNRDALIENEILYQRNIFKLFSVKFDSDANKDLERNRKKLYDLGESCSNYFDKIHSIIMKRKKNGEIDNDEDNEFDIAIEVVNMDYWSVKQFFDTLKSKYLNDSEIYPLLDHICDNLSEMRRISKKHTNIIESKKHNNHK